MTNPRRMSDDFYSLIRFRERLSRATDNCDQTGVVIDVPATVRNMAAQHSITRLTIAEGPEGTLTVRSGAEAFFTVQVNAAGRAPTIALVREDIGAAA